MILTVAKHHRHAHHKHAHHKEQYQDDEPKSKLRKLAVPITLIVILMYAAQWAAPQAPSTWQRGLPLRQRQQRSGYYTPVRVANHVRTISN